MRTVTEINVDFADAIKKGDKQRQKELKEEFDKCDKSDYIIHHWGKGLRRWGEK